MGEKKVYILYDERVMICDTDDCAVMCTAQTEAEAWRDSKMFRGTGSVWYEYDLVGKTTTNERRRPDIGKGILR